jgi:hypothetical protein
VAINRRSPRAALISLASSAPRGSSTFIGNCSARSQLTPLALPLPRPPLLLLLLPLLPLLPLPKLRACAAAACASAAAVRTSGQGRCSGSSGDRASASDATP